MTLVNYAISKNIDKNKLIDIFNESYAKNPEDTLVDIMMIRSIYKFGRRDTGRFLYKLLAEKDKELAEILIYQIPVIGRYDDLFCFFDTPLEKEMISFVSLVLSSDIENAKYGNNITTLAKWMPSVNTSSKKTRKLAKRLAKELGFIEREYRQILSNLRNHSRLLERNMSSNNWDKIDKIPKLALKKYKKALKRHKIVT